MVGLIFKCYIFSKSKLMILVFSTKQSEHTINQKPIILNATWNCKSKKSPLKSNKKNSNLDPCSRFQGQFYFQQLPKKIWFWFQILRLFIVALPSPPNPTLPTPPHPTPHHPKNTVRISSKESNKRLLDSWTSSLVFPPTFLGFWSVYL